LRERVGVRGISNGKLKISDCYHPHPDLPHQGGGEKIGFPDENYLKQIMARNLLFKLS